MESLGFKELADYGDYLMVQKDGIEIHFFTFPGLRPKENYGQVYIRTDDIDTYYKSLLAANIEIHPNGHLDKACRDGAVKLWIWPWSYWHTSVIFDWGRNKSKMM